MTKTIDEVHRAARRVGAMMAAKHLADQSVVVAARAAELDVEGRESTPFQKALILRSQTMMDCAVMIKDWVETL